MFGRGAPRSRTEEGDGQVLAMLGDRRAYRGQRSACGEFGAHASRRRRVSHGRRGGGYDYISRILECIKMKIVELQIKNYLRIKAATIWPDRPLVEIVGRNGQGKSSALNSIVTALKGKAAAPPKPIREGAEECIIKLDMGELVALREFKMLSTGDVTTKLTLTRADGSRVGEKPQAVLDALCGSLAFNPLEFAGWEPRKQFDALREFVKGFDFADYEEKRKKAYDARTEANRKAEQFQAAADKIAVPAGKKPEVAVAAEILAEIERAEQHNRDVEARAKNRKDALDRVEVMRDEAEAEQAQVNSKKQKADELEKKVADSPPLPALLSTAHLRQKLIDAEVINAVIRNHEEKARYANGAATSKKESETQTATIKKLDTEKEKAIASAELPVEGLDLIDGAVSFNGLPFEQASTSEKIRVSMAIAMKLNPSLKVVLIDDGEHLDKDARALIASIAEQNGFQVWMTRVTDGDAVGIQIENGKIASP
jgi:hypothetical protein